MMLRHCFNLRGWQTLGTYSRLSKNAQRLEVEAVARHLSHQPQGSINVSTNTALQLQARPVQLSCSAVAHVSGTTLHQDTVYSSQCLNKGQELSVAGQAVIEQEYHCPSQILEKLTNLVILDRAVPAHSFYDLPILQSDIGPVIAPEVVKEKVTDPTTDRTPEDSIGKLAKQIMRIRHKKMKKHKLRKLRKRMYFVWRKRKIAKLNKKNLLYKKEMEDIRLTGENFDPKEFVKEQLQKAKRGGYYINVFESKS